MEILTGSLFYIEVGDDATVADLKKEIAAKQEWPTERLIIVRDSAGDEDAEDDQNHLIIKDEQSEESLAGCGIKDGSKIHLFFHPIVDDGSSQQSVSVSTPTDSAKT